MLRSGTMPRSGGDTPIATATAAASSKFLRLMRFLCRRQKRRSERGREGRREGERNFITHRIFWWRSVQQQRQRHGAGAQHGFARRARLGAEQRSAWRSLARSLNASVERYLRRRSRHEVILMRTNLIFLSFPYSSPSLPPSLPLQRTSASRSFFSPTAIAAPPPTICLPLYALCLRTLLTPKLSWLCLAEAVSPLHEDPKCHPKSIAREEFPAAYQSPIGQSGQCFTVTSESASAALATVSPPPFLPSHY